MQLCATTSLVKVAIDQWEKPFSADSFLDLYNSFLYFLF